MKTLRLLPQPIKGILLSHYNDCLALGIAPDHWKLSKVIMIYIYIQYIRLYKYKGNNKSSRYLPISLANSIYQVYASMIQQSSPHPPHLFLLRRLTEILEHHSTSLHRILFLDWSHAFDSVGHPHLAAALSRYGVPPLLLKAMSLYSNAQFLRTFLQLT